MNGKGMNTMRNHQRSEERRFDRWSEKRRRPSVKEGNGDL